MISLPWQAWILVAAVAGLAFIGGIFFTWDWLRRR